MSLSRIWIPPTTPFWADKDGTLKPFEGPYTAAHYEVDCQRLKEFTSGTRERKQPEKEKIVNDFDSLSEIEKATRYYQVRCNQIKERITALNQSVINYRFPPIDDNNTLTEPDSKQYEVERVRFLELIVSTTHELGFRITDLIPHFTTIDKRNKQFMRITDVEIAGETTGSLPIGLKFGEPPRPSLSSEWS